MKDHPPVLDKHTDDAEALGRELASINIRLGLRQRKDFDREASSAWKRRQANEEIALINQQLLVLRQARTCKSQTNKTNIFLIPDVHDATKLPVECSASAPVRKVLKDPNTSDSTSHDEAAYQEFALGQGRKVLIDKRMSQNVSKRLTLDSHKNTDLLLTRSCFITCKHVRIVASMHVYV